MSTKQPADKSAAAGKRKAATGANSKGAPVKTPSTTELSPPPVDPVLTLSLEVSKKTQRDLRDYVEQLKKRNSALEERIRQQEEDTLEIITSLRRENANREEEKRTTQERFDAEMAKLTQERDNHKTAYEKEIFELRESLTERENQLKVMHQELVDVKDFRKKRQEMLKDLEIQKAEVLDLERRHKESTMRMEKKFFEEKLRLQKDANHKISDLALKAHREAVANLNETTKSVFRENMRMVEALKHHVQLGDDLEKQNQQLVDMNRKLEGEKELHDVIIREKIVKGKYHDMEVRALQSKVLSMEHSLTHIVQEFERERQIIVEATHKELESMKQVAAVLHENLRKKTSEMKYIRRLVIHLLQQRTDLERFFMDALEHVRQQRAAELERAKKDKMDAIVLESNLVPTTVQQKKLNQVLSPVTAANYTKPLTLRSGIVDIGKLDWSDKERILRLLFAKMNGILPENLPGASHGPAKTLIGQQEELISKGLYSPVLDDNLVNEALESHEKAIRETISEIK